MKRTERIGALIRILTENPSKPFALRYFCDMFGCAKSSISEDIHLTSFTITRSWASCPESSPGSSGTAALTT